MIPVKIGLLDIENNRKMYELALNLAPGDLLDDPGAVVFGAVTEDNFLAGIMILVPEEEYLRINWMRVDEEFRDNGIAITFIEAITDYLAYEETPGRLLSWIPADEDGESLARFLESTDLFDVTKEDSDTGEVYIAVWNGETFSDLDALEEQ